MTMASALRRATSRRSVEAFGALILSAIFGALGFFALQNVAVGFVLLFAAIFGGLAAGVQLWKARRVLVRPITFEYWMPTRPVTSSDVPGNDPSIAVAVPVASSHDLKETIDLNSLLRKRIYAMDGALTPHLAGVRWYGSSDTAGSLSMTALTEQKNAYHAGSVPLRKVVKELELEATRTLSRKLYDVTQKTTLAPSGDPRDYWNPAPYWWPNPETVDGLPYVQRDGVRVLGTVLGSAGSEQYDRTALQRVFEETYLCALAAFFLDDLRFVTRAESLISAWFLNPATRMNPNLTYAQVRRGHQNDIGMASGVIDSKDLHFFLDGVLLLEKMGHITGSKSASLREWFLELLGWLENSDQGNKAKLAENNLGTWHDVQTIAIRNFIGQGVEARRAFGHVRQRLHKQILDDGSQPLELSRTLSQHYCAYNTQGWIALASLGLALGDDVKDEEAEVVNKVRTTTEWLVEAARPSWPYEQIEPFEAERTAVLWHLTATLGSGHGHIPEHVDPIAWNVRQVFTSTEGIRPLWALGRVRTGL